MAIKDVVLGYAKGDKGDRGPQGEKGATGAIGPKGDPGNIADAQITDTEGLDVAKGQKTTAQKLFDAIANRIVTKLVTNDALTKKLADYMLKGMMSNTNVNNTGTVPTSALMYSMFEQINNNIGNTGKYLRTDNIDNAAETLWPKIEGSSSYDFTWIPENAGGITAGAKARVIGSYINSEYETQMVLSYLSSAPVVQREKINGSWGEWKAFVIKSDLFTYEQKFENKDLNTIISPGCYGIGGKPSVSGATNYPEDTTGMLVVFCNTGVVAQHYYTYLGSMYLRSKLVNYNNWSSWEKITK